MWRALEPLALTGAVGQFTATWDKIWATPRLKIFVRLSLTHRRKVTVGLVRHPATRRLDTAELERLLRPYDRDATTLPARLAAIATGAAVRYPLQRTTVTTDSWDVPSVSSAIPADVMTAGAANPVTLLSSLKSSNVFPPRHISDLLKALVMKAGSLASPPSDTEMTLLFAPELLAGRKMDLNRAFGNGRDDNGNGVVDEPDPAESASAGGENVTLFKSTAATNNTSTGTTSYDPAGSLPEPSPPGQPAGLEARQLYARYLYVLAMLVVDPAGLQTSSTYVAAHNADGVDVARFLAQWAVNVVDFYDRDSIMTPFIYNPTPFTSTGWNETTYHLGYPTAADTSNVVWGCERPELLISETLAFHDRRTEDRSDDDGIKTTTAGDASGNNKDPNFDQRFKPQGSLFVELYNPWSDLEPRPTELCTAGNGGVDLTKKTPVPVGGGTTYPVWRLAIVKQADSVTDPDAPTGAPVPAPVPVRTVYFTSNTDATVTLPSDGAVVQFRPNSNFNGQIAPIMPGRYVVIGPGESTDTTFSRTYLGFNTTSKNPGGVTDPTAERRIELTPSNNTVTVGQVAVYNNAGTTSDFSSLSVQNPTAIVINTPQRLSVSEPTTGYAGQPESTPFSPPKDTPIDWSDVSLPSEIKLAIWNDGRTDRVAAVHLQRLANPLMPYDATQNPYRTIDSMQIDLTAFNGIDPTEQSKNQIAPQSPVISLTNNGQFWARQRGQNNGTTVPPSIIELWCQEPLTGPLPGLPPKLKLLRRAADPRQ